MEIANIIYLIDFTTKHYKIIKNRYGEAIPMWTEIPEDLYNEFVFSLLGD
jgi:hypothetical protein